MKNEKVRLRPKLMTQRQKRKAPSTATATHPSLSMSQLYTRYVGVAENFW